jgi:hypothetical protein
VRGNAKNPRSCTAELGTFSRDLDKVTTYRFSSFDFDFDLMTCKWCVMVRYFRSLRTYEPDKAFFTANRSNHTDYLGPCNPHLTVFSECVEPAYRNLEWHEPNCVLTHPRPPSLIMHTPTALPPSTLYGIGGSMWMQAPLLLTATTTTPLNPRPRDNLARHYRHYAATKGDADLLLRPPTSIQL